MKGNRDLPVPWALTRLNLARYVYHIPTQDVDNLDWDIVSLDLKLLDIEAEIAAFENQKAEGR